MFGRVTIQALLSLSLLSLLSLVNSKPNGRNKLLYIMLDGFRYDYIDDQPADALPGFNRLLNNGVRAEYMTPIFPSLSYPDWTTLVTGLYAESHGIVGNYFYDAEEKEYFSLFDAEVTGKKKWWTAEPIWTTATKGGLRTSVILWSRCDILYDGFVPEYCEPFIKIRGYEIFKTNMEKALNKLEEGFDFIQMYNEHADNIGHDIGPETDDRRQAIRDLDTTIVYMLDRIEEMGMTDQVNIVIVGDHGMAKTTNDTVTRVELDDFLLADHVESVADAGAFSNLKVKDGYVDQVYEGLKQMSGVEVYRHNEIPEELHFKNNKYIHDIVLKSDIHTFMMKSRSPAMFPARGSYVYYGAHGFDPNEEKMRAIFFASGPDFKTGIKIPPIDNVDVYPLLARLLLVKPMPNNGTFDNIKMALVDPMGQTTTTTVPPTTPNAAVSISATLATVLPFLGALLCLTA